MNEVGISGFLLIFVVVLIIAYGGQYKWKFVPNCSDLVDIIPALRRLYALVDFLLFLGL